VIVAIIWKQLFSDRSDRFENSENDRRDRPQFYIDDRSNVVATVNRCDEEYTKISLKCNASLFDSGPLGHFFYGDNMILAIVAVVFNKRSCGNQP
jgi:hypothetical protein